MEVIQTELKETKDKIMTRLEKVQMLMIYIEEACEELDIYFESKAYSFENGDFNVLIELPLAVRAENIEDGNTRED